MQSDNLFMCIRKMKNLNKTAEISILISAEILWSHWLVCLFIHFLSTHVLPGKLIKLSMLMLKSIQTVEFNFFFSNGERKKGRPKKMY